MVMAKGDMMFYGGAVMMVLGLVLLLALILIGIHRRRKEDRLSEEHGIEGRRSGEALANKTVKLAWDTEQVTELIIDEEDKTEILTAEMTVTELVTKADQ